MTRRRGLTLVELMLALAISAMVGGAIAAMLAAVNHGMGARSDARSAIVRAGAVSGRLSAYVAPARALLDVGDDRLAIWLHDDRDSDTVHATEVRWLVFDPDAGTLSIDFVQFPDDWSQAAKDMDDAEYPSTADFWLVRTKYAGAGYLASLVIAESIADLRIVATAAPSEQETRHLVFLLDFAGEDGTATEIAVPATLRELSPPAR